MVLRQLVCASAVVTLELLPVLPVPVPVPVPDAPLLLIGLPFLSTRPGSLFSTLLVISCSLNSLPPVAADELPDPEVGMFPDAAEVFLSDGVPELVPVPSVLPESSLSAGLSVPRVSPLASFASLTPSVLLPLRLQPSQDVHKFMPAMSRAVQNTCLINVGFFMIIVVLRY